MPRQQMRTIDKNSFRRLIRAIFGYAEYTRHISIRETNARLHLLVIAAERDLLEALLRFIK